MKSRRPSYPHVEALATPEVDTPRTSGMGEPALAGCSPAGLHDCTPGAKKDILSSIAFQKGRSTMKGFSGAIRSFLAVAVLSLPAVAQQPKIYNTVKLKLAEGKQVFSYTQTKFD